MKRFVLSLLSVLTLFCGKAADLIRLAPVTNKIVLLQFDDGYILKHGYHQGSDADVAFLWAMDTELADNLKTYSISSSDDSNYSSPLNPAGLGRKSKGHDFSEACKNWLLEPWAGAACKNDYASYHYIYLEMPQAMISGKHYTVKFGDLADNMESFTFVFDEKISRSEAIHVNQTGYVPSSQKKFAYISQWMGSLGPLIEDGLTGRPFDLLEIDGNGVPGNSVFSGSVGLQHKYDQPDNDRSNESPHSNFVASNVYECDFSAFSDPGEYIVVVKGVGCSFPFRIAEDVYQEAFYAVMKGLYLERGLIAEDETSAGRWAHPAMDNAGFVYTSVRTLDLTDESGSNQRKNIFDSFDWSVDLSGMRGWYHDAGDWDGYFSHFRIPRSLMLAYELAPDNFKDGELNIPESQVAYNGYSGTHIPDILDEAVWLVDYFKHNVGPTGGIFGSRIDPDISNTNEGAGISEASYPDFVFSDKCRVSGIPSWEDCCTWIVQGEDPRDSYAFAGIASQYAYNLHIASVRTGEDYSTIISDYLNAAKDAYDWAQNNTLAGDESKSAFVENRAAAAAWLYKETGEEKYIDQLRSDLATRNITASSTSLGECQWAVWAYVTIDGTQPLYIGSFDQTLYDDLVSATIKDAEVRVTNAIDNNRSMRMGGHYSLPVWNGQGTTPWIEPAMVASVVALKNSNPEAGDFLNACYTTCDYFLGGNQMNMVWLTQLGHVRPEQIMHLDSEFNTSEPGYIPGIPPYGPRPRCDWFAPGPPHPFAGDNCYYNNSHDADFALLDGRIYPAYNDDQGNLLWPVHELYFDNYGSPPTNEFTTHQTVAPAAAAYGFLTAVNGATAPNAAPLVTISSSANSYARGEDITINISASDADGWIYQVDLYQDNRLIASLNGSTTSFEWKAGKAGNLSIFAVASDNLGARKKSDEIVVQVSDITDAPSVILKGLKVNGLYRKGSAITLNAGTAGQVSKVQFYYYNTLIGEDTEAPYFIEWTPVEEGTAVIRAIAVGAQGLEAKDSKSLIVTSDCLTLVEPVENSVFEPGENIVLKTLGSSCAVQVSKVSFHINSSTVLEDLTPAPVDGSYDVSFQSVKEGAYTAYAIAQTGQGMIISDSVHFAIKSSGPDGIGGGYEDEIMESFVYPNPSESGFHFRMSLNVTSTVKIKIYDVYGHLVNSMESEVPAGTYKELYWEAEGRKAGVYFFSMSASKSIRHGMIVIN